MKVLADGVERDATPEEIAEIESRQVVNLPALKQQLATAIDDRVAAVLTKSTRFQLGYEQREAAALAFQAAGYTGDATVWVTRFATNTGQTPTQAANLILAQANQLRGALVQLEALRMDKYVVLAKGSASEAMETYNGIIAAVDAIAAQL